MQQIGRKCEALLDRVHVRGPRRTREGQVPPRAQCLWICTPVIDTSWKRRVGENMEGLFDEKN
jgi:hypothetical protein